MNEYDYNNEIIEIDSDNNSNIPEVLEQVEKEPKVIVEKKPKKTLKDKWLNIPKKNRTIIIVVLSLLLLVIIGLIIYFTLLKKEQVEDVPEETVILEKDNYRYENGKLLFLDKNDKVIGEYECINKDPEKCMVMKIDYSTDKFERVLSVYETGEEITRTSQIYYDNFVFVTDGKDSNLYNIEEKKNEDLKVNTIKTYGTEKNLVVIANEDDKYGLVEITSEGYEYLIRPSYNNLGIINTKLVYLVAQDKEKNYIIDSEGKKISSNITGTITSLNDKYIVVIKNKTYNLYSYEYEELLSDYDYISLSDSTINIVKNNRLYLRDKELNKLNEEGIRLDNSDYIKKYVYDKDNKLKETKNAFEVVVKDNYAMITINDDTKTINLNEGLVNTKYEYMSYFDGKLYFYNDLEKEDILGIYNCNNKNEINDKDSLLDKCTILTTADGYTGIYNNDYAIIYDNNYNTDAKYYIYSLKEKKVKGTYSYIEIINKDEITNNIEHIGTNSSYIIAITDTGNNKGNYGVLEINSSKITGKVPFEYKEITVDSGYYLLKNTSDLYSIYNISFNKISNEFKYIKLYERYYVGINNDKLNVYRYLSTKGLLTEELSVTDNKYEIDFTEGIKITIDGKEYKYDANGKEIVEKVEIDNNTGDNTNEEG